MPAEGQGIAVGKVHSHVIDPGISYVACDDSWYLRWQVIECEECPQFFRYYD